VRRGHAGPRRRVLVVDNEADDRGLLADMLGGLGFELRLAASGDACLALLREAGDGWCPDAILMDLAMPGIDGWETIRQLRAQGLSQAPVAIVSANAFDRGLDNDAGVRAEDFVLKPVRRGELLDWLGRVLALQWLTDADADADANADADACPAPAAAPGDPAAPPAGPPLPPATVLPPRDALQGLAEQVRLGYLRGVHRWLDHIDAGDPACGPFTQRLRTLARGFQLDALADAIAAALAAPEADHA